MKILIAEDELFFRHLLVSTVQRWGYETVSVADGLKAWEVLREDEAPKIAILDWMMPGMDGTEVCRLVRGLAKPESTYIIMLTSKGGKQNTVAALESGADDFITKPFDNAELRARLNVGTRIVGLQTSQAVVFAFARAVEAKSPYTQGHAQRVTEYALRLAAAVGLSALDCDTIRRGGLLHDIGKISVPDAILDKPGQLTHDEMELIKRHPVDGVAMIESLQSLRDAVPLVRWHHERVDGRGYPDGLSGDAIPLMVRILSVADVYDALSSCRPYREPVAHEDCLAILRENASGGGLDPALVEQFARVITGPAAWGGIADAVELPKEAPSAAGGANWETLLAEELRSMS